MDWGKLFLKIAESPLGRDPRFSSEEFSKQPMWLIEQVLVFLDEKYKQDANVNSLTVAKAALGWAGKDSKLSIEDFLPYRTSEESGDEKKGFQVTAKTARIFMRLVKADVLPTKIVSAATGFINDIQRLAGD